MRASYNNQTVGLINGCVQLGFNQYIRYTLCRLAPRNQT